MIKRWIIRSFFIGLLVICVAAWVGSYWWYLFWERDFSIGGGFCARDTVQVYVGQLEISRILQGMAPLATKWGVSKNGPEGVMAYDYSYWTYHWAGFGISPTYGLRIVFVPLWFPSSLSVLLLWFVWRKTRPMLAGRAFPVEHTESPAESE